MLIGYITNLAIPRAGEVAKCTVLAKYEKIPAHKMIGTIVAERAFDILCLLVIAVAAFVLQLKTISDYVGDKMHLLGEKILRHQGVLFSILALVAILIVALIMVYRRHRETKVGKFIKELAHGVMSIIHMKKRWPFMGYTILIWFMYLLQIYIGLVSMPATQHLSMLAALVVLVYGSVGMIVTPGGIGMYTLLVAQILGVYNIPDVPAQAFGWIAWAVPTCLIIIMGVASLLLIHPLKRKNDAQAAVDTK